MDWYPRNSRQALKGMEGLTLEERGAYNTILDLIYARGEPIPDDERHLAGIMGVSIRKWRLLRESLLAKGRMIVRRDRKGAVLSDEVAERELENQATRRRLNAESGASGGRKTAENRRIERENNDLSQATAQASLKLETKTETDSSVPNGTVSVRRPTTPAVKREHVEAIWQSAPRPSRERSSQKQTDAALRSEAKKGEDPAAVIAGCRGYFGSDGATKDGGTFAMAVHRVITSGRWQTFLERPKALEWDADRWRGAVALFAESGKWGETCGPRPSEPQCRAPPNILAEFGFAPQEGGAKVVPFERRLA